MMEEFKYARLGENPTKEEIEREIKRLTALTLDLRNDEQATKIIINSFYGVAGYKKFVDYNKVVAQSITRQSEDQINETERFLNHYFTELWHLDFETHKKLGITKFKKVNAPVVKYCDTDSAFASLNGVYRDTDFKGDIVDFILALQKFKLNDYIKESLIAYGEKYCADGYDEQGFPYQSLALEQICSPIIWTAKKRYIKNTLWKKGIRYPHLSKVEIKGAFSSSMTKYARKTLKELFIYILSEGSNLRTHGLLGRISKIKDEFSIINIEDICITEKVNNYDKFVLNDTTEFEIGPNCKPHTRGAALYNYLLYNHSGGKYRSKYNFISSGQRVKYYYTTDGDKGAFGFIGGVYPFEFARACDYDKQFEKVILGPLNKILEAIGFQTLDSELILYPSIF